MLGSEIARRLGHRFDESQLVLAARTDLDITDGEAVRRRLSAARPALVINAAAYTDVDGCETGIDHAMKVNAVAVGFLADACKSLGATLVHVSTDFVFDGRGRRPYRPDDQANPLSAYGRSKWEGEVAIRASGAEHLIVRTSWMFGPAGRNFVEAILARASRGEPLRVVDDQIGRPTRAGDLADALLRLLDADARGTLHFANAGSCSWHEFAKEIVRQAGFDVPVTAIPSSELGRPAPRPAYSVLDTSEYERVTGDHPRPWSEALGEYLSERRQPRAGAGLGRASRVSA